MEKIYIFIFIFISFFEKIIICFVIVESDPRVRYYAQKVSIVLYHHLIYWKWCEPISYVWNETYFFLGSILNSLM
jgi:hypothetical protein